MTVQLMEWKVSAGQLEGFDPDTLEYRCSISSTADGWLVVIHGSALNDEGTSYQWSRQEFDEGNRPVLAATVGDARARAEQLAPRFVAEHVSSDEARRKLDAKERLEAQRATLAVDLGRVAGELAAAEPAPEDPPA